MHSNQRLHESAVLHSCISRAGDDFQPVLKVVNNCRISEMKWIFVLYVEYVDISNDGLFFSVRKISAVSWWSKFFEVLNDPLTTYQDCKNSTSRRHTFVRISLKMITFLSTCSVSGLSPPKIWDSRGIWAKQSPQASAGKASSSPARRSLGGNSLSHPFGIRHVLRYLLKP